MVRLSTKEVPAGKRSRLYAQLKPCSLTSHTANKRAPPKSDAMEVGDEMHEDRSDASDGCKSHRLARVLSNNHHVLPTCDGKGDVELDAFTSRTNRLLLHEIITSIPPAAAAAASTTDLSSPATSAVTEALLALRDYVSVTTAEVEEARRRVSELERQNEGLIQTRGIEVERLRSVSQGLVDRLLAGEREVRMWRGMALDRDGEVRRYERLVAGEAESESDGE